MYSQVKVLPVTGVGTAAASSGAAFALSGIWFWVFMALAVFALIGAVGAFMRTMPTMGFMYREPTRLAPDGRPKRSRWSGRRR